MPPTNNALWYNKPDGVSTKVKPAPYPSPKKDELVIKTCAIAINPIDSLLLTPMAKNGFPWLKYPTIVGCDLAGEVVDVGSSVTRFKKGDRVTACSAGTSKQRPGAEYGAFQNYVVALDNMTTRIPDRIAFEDAVVIPLAVSTAAAGMFQKDMLALQYPQAQGAKTGETVVIWGGSTSVGANAVQLAVAAGYNVISTASPKNFDFVKRLGASQVFDYKSKTVARDIISAVGSDTLAGAVAIGYGSTGACIDIVAKCKGAKSVASLSIDIPEGAGTAATIAAYVSSSASNWLKSKTKGVKCKFVSGTEPAFNEVGKVIWEDFLPQALENGAFVCEPAPLIFGSGIESIEGAMKRHKEGVSAKKIVVSI